MQQQGHPIGTSEINPKFAIRHPQSEVEETIATLARRLLSMRSGGGYWEGELASSALSTATAVAALSFSRFKAPEHERLVRAGLSWLARNRNQDGGWGDTVKSKSNISTTALCWAALEISGDRSAELEPARAGAEAWLQRAAGSLQPERLAERIAERYGKDRTFSAPILTTLALSGGIGVGTKAWEVVPQLPFEIAALPRSFFRWVRFPVVSYALPALIAIGQARHHQCPSRNPVTRIARYLCRGRTLKILQEIQPRSGGYLEAVPLTSFVILSLIASDSADNPVVDRGVKFLKASVRSDGSWPIDTNLATWVTTLSVNALSLLSDFPLLLPAEERAAILDWLLGQQYRTTHPYSGADPGGWAWTDLTGGVPDADDTAGALLALRNLAPEDARSREAAIAGARWLLDLQNRDGGMPTFCRGWGTLPFDRSSPDLTAHALWAWAEWKDRLPRHLGYRVQRSIRHAIRYLQRVQRSDGAWVPLWFGSEYAEGEENPTYGTARVVSALHNARAFGLAEISRIAENGRRWLLSSQNPDGGWGGSAGAPSSIEETGLTLGALAAGSTRMEPALEKGARWLVEHTCKGTETPPAPIGLYFAKLWYFEKLYPLIFALSGLAQLVKIGYFRPHAR